MIVSHDDGNYNPVVTFLELLTPTVVVMMSSWCYVCECLIGLSESGHFHLGHCGMDTLLLDTLLMDTITWTPCPALGHPALRPSSSTQEQDSLSALIFDTLAGDPFWKPFYWTYI